MAAGICFTQSGNVKRYEPNKLSLPDFATITGMQASIKLSKSIMSYPPPPDYPAVEGFVEGTAHYKLNITVDSFGVNKDIYNYLYNDISYSPPQGYKLDKNGEYTYTYIKRYKLDTFSSDYGGITKYFKNEGFLIYKDFKYTKLGDIYKYYDVVFSLTDGRIYCKCNGVSDIPGTNNGNFTLGVKITIGNGNNAENFNFSWVMKTGINEYKYTPNNYDKYGGSGFTTRNGWEQDNGDYTKTIYLFRIDASSIQKL